MQAHKRRRDEEPEIEANWASVAREIEGDLPPPHTQESPCVGEERRAGLGQGLPTGSPKLGSRVSPYRAMLWSTYYILRARHVRLGRHVNSLPCVLFTGRSHDECLSPRRERTQRRYTVLLLHRAFTGLVAPKKPPLTHRDGVGGLFGNLQCYTVTSMQPAAAAATAGKRVCQRLVGTLDLKARSTMKFMDVCDVEVVDEDDFLACGMMIKAQKTPS